MKQRVERVARMLAKEVGTAIREDLPEAAPGFITILRADVTSDLKSARVVYSVMGDEGSKKRCEDFVHKYAKTIKRIVNDRINLRYAIDLVFFRDSGLDHAFKIQGILNSIAKDKGGESSPTKDS